MQVLPTGLMATSATASCGRFAPGASVILLPFDQVLHRCAFRMLACHIGAATSTRNVREVTSLFRLGRIQSEASPAFSALEGGRHLRHVPPTPFLLQISL